MSKLTLSPDMFYPDCEPCETNLYVHRSTVTGHTFECQRCQHRWDDVEFDAVFDLKQRQQTLYILHRHGGYPISKLDRTFPSEKACLHEYRHVRRLVRRKIDGPIPSDGELDPTGGIRA